MTSYFEESDRKYLEEEIQGILNKYNQVTDERCLLKDLISFSHLMLHKKQIQKQFTSNCRCLDYNINDPNNAPALAAMQRIANSLSVTKIAKINLTNFFSVEANMVLKAIDNSDVFVNISFLRNEDVLRKNGKWIIVDYTIHCGQDLDNMFTILKLSFAYKGDLNPSCCYAYDSSIDESNENDVPTIDEPEDELKITEAFSDGFPSSESDMSEDERIEEEDKEAEKEEEELLEFDVNNDNLIVLGNLVEPNMSYDIFLMYLVSLGFISLK